MAAAAQHPAATTPPPLPPPSDISSCSPGSSTHTPPPPPASDDDLLRSFLNNDFLATSDVNASLYPGATDDYDYPMSLDDPVLTSDPLAPLTDAEMMEGLESLQSTWALINDLGGCSPESSMSGLQTFSHLSPPSAASIRSPSMDWLLDFDDPLKMVPMTMTPGPAVVAPNLSPMEAAHTWSPPVQPPPPAGGQQWKFVNCSAPNDLVASQRQQQQHDAHAKCNSIAAPLASHPPPAEQGAPELAGPIPHHQQQPLAILKPSHLREPLFTIKSEPQTDKSQSREQQQQNSIATTSTIPQPLSLASKPPPLASTRLPFVPTAKAQIQQLHELRKQPLLPPKPPADPSAPLTPEQKRAERLLRNRAAALESRKRKREIQTKLEEQTENLVNENTMLIDRLKQLEDRNRALELENSLLRQNKHCACGQLTVFSGSMFAPQPLPVTAVEQRHLVELPDKKTVGTVLMTVFFSFALIFLPGMISSSSHLGGHIVGRAYSASAPNTDAPLLPSAPAAVQQASTGYHLLDAPPQQILYLPASASPLLGGPSTSRDGLVPVLRTDLMSRRVESTVALPLDWRFGDMLAGLASRVESNHRGSGPITKLRNLFRNTKDGLSEHITPPAAATTASLTPRRRSGAVARRLLHHPAAEITPHNAGVREFVRIPADHATQYNADGSSAPKAIPHISIDDSIHLLSYQEQQEAPTHVTTDSTAEASARPKFSLLATVPDVRNDAGDERGAFLQLDVEVVGARLVTWNTSHESVFV
ncbi:hypothetical protein BDZ88DRAFT_510531 [Geranomyces variabilis]|nr:hypothetical protein BDZ88DRAFT_510531 [Geranomyces variabilis]KAJ3131496.1 hypothetical protein HDU90_008239 [Geranomyces variabilis]